jgi:hypothetical protein
VILDVKMPVLDWISAAEWVAAQQIAPAGDPDRVLLTGRPVRHVLRPGTSRGTHPGTPGAPGDAACQILRKPAAAKSLFLHALYQWRPSRGTF